MAPAATATAANVHAHLCSFLLLSRFLVPYPQQTGRTQSWRAAQAPRSLVCPSGLRGHDEARAGKFSWLEQCRHRSRRNLRTQLEPDNRLQLLGELRIVADFKTGYPVRLEAVTAPNASDTRWADPRSLGHKRATPVRGHIWGAARRTCHDLLRLNNPWPPGAVLIGLQCLIAALQKPTANAPAPLTRDPQRQSNRRVVCTLRRQ